MCMWPVMLIGAGGPGGALALFSGVEAGDARSGGDADGEAAAQEL